MILSNPQSFLIMLLLKAGAKPTESPLWCYPLSGTRPETAVVCGGGFDHTIIEYQVGRDLKDHLVQPFLAKAQSRQDGPAPCPARS